MAQSEISKESMLLIRKTMREVSLSRLAFHSRHESIKLVEIPDSPVVFGHWMTMILLAGKELRLTFKVHFMSSDSVMLAGNTFDPQKMTQEQTAGFFREFCNLTAGKMKDFLEKNEIRVGTSLPVMSRGFDEVFYPPPVGMHTETDQWRLELETAKVDCSVTYEFFKPVVLNVEHKEEQENLGDVEFF